MGPGDVGGSMSHLQSRGESWECPHPTRNLRFKLKLPSGSENVKFLCETQPYSPFLSRHRSHCWFFSLTLWQKDQWTNLTKPFWFHSSSVLRTVLKLCRKGSCYSHSPYFVVEYGVKKKVWDSELYQCIPWLWELFQPKVWKYVKMLCYAAIDLPWFIFILLWHVMVFSNILM